MKTTPISKYVLLFITSMSIISCSTKFDDSYYIDPNNPSKASGTQLIANSQFYLPNVSSSAFGVHYPQYLSLTTFTDNTRFISSVFNFSTWYTGPLNNLENVISNADVLNANEGPVINQLAVAKILKSFFTWHVTDRWGDIPYSEALQGTAMSTPKYDKQQDIYNNIFTLLEEANSSIVTTNGAIKNDIVYGGNILKWKKLGNTIHLLMALRLSKVDPEKGKIEFAKALAAGVFESNADNLSYPHLAEVDHENFWYTSFTRLGRKWYALSKPLVDYMKPLNDPRLPFFGDKNSVGEYNGLEFGKAIPNPDVDIPQVSLLGERLREQNSPVNIVTYAQVLFAKAEAAKLGWIVGGDVQAKIFYEDAITQSISQWTGSTSSAADFIAQTTVQYNSTKAIQQIAEQRWVHLFLNGYEAWAEWRRTGFPLLTLSSDNNGGKIPRREGYPSQEATNNKTNYNAAVASFPYGGPDGFDTRVWWDKP